jgi:hypothetical protein
MRAHGIESKRPTFTIVDPSTGQPRIGVTLERFVADMRSSEDFSALFRQEPQPEKRPVAGNPWRPESFNATEQVRLMKCNPGLAARMRKEAAEAE